MQSGRPEHWRDPAAPADAPCAERISVTTMDSRSVFGWTSTVARARTVMLPRPVS